MSKAKDEGDLNPQPKKVKFNLGTNIHRLREAAGLSQMDVACGAKLDLTTVNNIETGKTDASLCSLSRIRKALKASWSKILSGV